MAFFCTQACASEISAEGVLMLHIHQYSLKSQHTASTDFIKFGGSYDGRWTRVGHGLDPSMDWIGLDPITVIPFFHL